MEIELKNVKYSYSRINYISKTVIQNLNMKITSGKIHGIIGPSGSGKTTLGQLLAGILKPDSGQIIMNKDLLIESCQYKVGFVSQEIEDEYNEMTVKQRIEMDLILFGHKKENIDQHISHSIIMVGLTADYLDRKISTLSSTEKQLVSLATTLSFNPKLLILDEPIFLLDKNYKKRIVKLLRLIKNRYKKTIVIISNNIDIILEITDYIHILYDGKITLSDKKMNVFSNPEILKKYRINLPKIIDFENYVLKKKKFKIGYRDNINDLLKDIYRYIR